MWNKTTVTLTKSAVFSLLALVIILSSCSGNEEAKPEAQRLVPGAGLHPVLDSILVAGGKQLFYSPTLGSTNKSCAFCHLGGEDLKGVADSYPKFSDLAAREVTLIEMNNLCIERALKGKPLGLQSNSARVLAAYVASLK